MADEDARAALQRLIEERGEDYAGLSRLIGRNPAYVQQYVKRGSPRRLAEADRRRLAGYFGVAEQVLGGPDASAETTGGVPVQVPLLDVGASAGAGAAIDGERARAHVAFDPVWLRRVASAGADALSVIRVTGDSMLPTLADGDEILVDRAAAATPPRDGIHVLRIDGALLVKRLAFNPAARTVSIISDNPVYPSFEGCDPAAIAVVGRALWLGRRLT